MSTIGIILGSTRLESNTAGIEAYLLSLLSTKFPHLKIESINLRTSPNHPLPLDLDPLPPAGHSLPALKAGNAYSNPRVNAWSQTVLKWDGMIIITPQYNWGIPAPLKNALDQLFNEFHDMPVGLICVGGRGGTKVEAHLRSVLGGGMDMRVCERGVNVALPKENIHGSSRVEGNEEWLDAYKEGMEGLVEELEGMLRDRFKDYTATK